MDLIWWETRQQAQLRADPLAVAHFIMTFPLPRRGGALACKGTVVTSSVVQYLHTEGGETSQPNGFKQT